jgi:hypothetical protein
LIVATAPPIFHVNDEPADGEPDRVIDVALPTATIRYRAFVVIITSLFTSACVNVPVAAVNVAVPFVTPSVPCESGVIAADEPPFVSDPVFRMKRSAQVEGLVRATEAPPCRR